MRGVDSFLVDWSIIFLENKDIIKKEIVKIEKDKDGFDFVIHYKDKEGYFIVRHILDESIFDKIKNDSLFGIFTINNVTNVNFIAVNWAKMAGYKLLNIYFINPFSNTGKAWILRPYVHDRICDKTSLKIGLNSMAEMVEPICGEELEKKARSAAKKSAL